MPSTLGSWSYPGLGNLALFYAIPLFERSVPTLGREHLFLLNLISLKIPPIVRADYVRDSNHLSIAMIGGGVGDSHDNVV